MFPINLLGTNGSLGTNLLGTYRCTLVKAVTGRFFFYVVKMRPEHFVKLIGKYLVYYVIFIHSFMKHKLRFLKIGEGNA